MTSLEKEIASAVIDYLKKCDLDCSDFVDEMKSRGLAKRTCYNFWKGRNIRLNTLHVVIKGCEIELSVDCRLYNKVTVAGNHQLLRDKWTKFRRERKLASQVTTPAG